MKRLVGGAERSLPRRRVSPNGLFIVAVSHNCIIGRFVRSQGVPETRAGPREGITGNLDRRQDRQGGEDD